MKIKNVLFNAIILILTSNAFSYDLETLKAAMSQNNPELLTLQEEYKRSELDVKDAYGSLGPTVDLQL